MNTEVVNEIFKRRPARDFLRLYPSDKWKELIPDIFEIGVLNLKNSFGTLKFTKNQIKDILVDLRNYKPNEEEINTNNINNNNNNNYEDQNNFEEENNNNNSDEEEEYNENENDEQNNNNIQNNNNNKLNNKNMINKEKEDIRERTANAEVFIPDENRHVIKVNYNRPKIAYNSTMEEIREQNIENKRNLGYTESKIKYQIINDKRNHQMKKRKISDDNNNDNNNNDGNFSFNKNKNKNKREKNMNKNYVINFDKNLNPGKPIEMQKNKFKYNIQNNYNFNNNNNVNNNNFNNNYNDYNEENIFNSFNNNNSVNNENNQINNEQNLQNHLNNYKINMLNFPRYEFDRNNLNDN